MNEHESSIHVNNNSRIQVVKPAFTTWEYKVKLSAEAASEGVKKKLFVKISQYSQENTCAGVSFK